MKSLPGEKLERSGLLIEELHARRVGLHQGHGCLNDTVVQRGDVAFLDHAAADFLQLLGGVELSRQLSFAATQTTQTAVALHGDGGQVAGDRDDFSAG